MSLNNKYPHQGPTSAAKKKKGGRRRKTEFLINQFDNITCAPGIVKQVISSVVKVYNLINNQDYTCHIRGKVRFNKVKTGCLVIIGFDNIKSIGEVLGIYSLDSISEMALHFNIAEEKLRKELNENVSNFKPTNIDFANTLHVPNNSSELGEESDEESGEELYEESDEDFADLVNPNHHNNYRANHRDKFNIQIQTQIQTNNTNGIYKKSIQEKVKSLSIDDV